MDGTEIRDLQIFATQIRIGIIEALRAKGVGHAGGSLSIADALAVLYGRVMNVDLADPKWPERDRLICSKGHAGPAIYAALALKGAFPYEKLVTLNQPGTMLPSHCDRNKTPGIDRTTGSLGQGASLAVGIALANRMRGRLNRVFVIIGDGECDEGQVWEAAMFAAANHLSNMIWLLDNNKKQLDGTVAEILDTGDLERRFNAFDFATQRVNGNDVTALCEAIDNLDPQSEKPAMIVLDTVKGAGVDEIERMTSNHSVSVSEEQGTRWIEQLRAELQELNRMERGNDENRI